MTQPRLRIRPTTLREACAFVALHHRHHAPPRGCRFALAVVDEAGAVRGVAISGRPTARRLDNGLTLEVTRVATDGCDNACSALYGACRRVAQAMGYARVLTYTLSTEPGTSLRASGWRCVGVAGGGTWSRKSRPRADLHPTQSKIRWEAA
jgi:hypothetical protein